jgi:precorrin-6A/cobalt-precorrin-6A reductase
MAAAATAIGREPRRVFLTIGRLQIGAFAAAPQHFYLIRTIEPLTISPRFPNYQVIHGRGPFVVEAEEKLLREEAIDVLVTKNSGGEAAFAKILAARNLGLPVIVIARPQQATASAFHDPAEAMALLHRHRSTLSPRGV